MNKISTEVKAAIVVGLCSITAACISAGIFSKIFVSENIENIPSWKLLYSHTETGARTNGDIEKLRNAVEAGYDIKVVIKNPVEGMEFSRSVLNIDQIQIRNNKVSGLNQTISWWPDSKLSENLVFPKRPYRIYSIIDTSGSYQYLRVFFDGTEDNRTQEKYSMEWLGSLSNTDYEK